MSNYPDAICLAEAVAGDSAVTHAATVASAVEKLTGGVPSARLGVCLLYTSRCV